MKELPSSKGQYLVAETVLQESFHKLLNLLRRNIYRFEMQNTDQLLSIGDFLITQFKVHGVSHVFGIPGDYILSFYSKLANSSIKIINTCDEQGAGFAADAYARINGLGIVCVTYNAGSLKLVNTTAQAYAEKVPVRRNPPQVGGDHAAGDRGGCTQASGDGLHDDAREGG